jgi:hypothetical protein
LDGAKSSLEKCAAASFPVLSTQKLRIVISERKVFEIIFRQTVNEVRISSDDTIKSARDLTKFRKSFLISTSKSLHSQGKIAHYTIDTLGTLFYSSRRPEGSYVQGDQLKV